MAWKLTAEFQQFAHKNRTAVREALRKVAPIIYDEILANTSPVQGGHLNDSGRMREKTKVIAVGGANPRIEVHTTDYGIYQDQGFTHYLGGYLVKNPWISPVIRGQRNSIMKRIAQEVRAYMDTKTKKK